ncbi:MAG TPA: FHA domain-containing protein [Bryobacteraceae bacterium]|nr:FHA domain-containing protein [Bryobacteraceae bacterium]
MNINEYLEKWGRTLFESSLAAKPGRERASEEPEELAEIRLAVLDKVREKSYRSGGRKVFPYDLLRIELRGVEEGRQAIFAGRFFQKYLEQELRNALRDAGCRFPDDLRLDVKASAGLPKRGEPWLVVELASQERAGGSAHAVGKLVVREGSANAPEVRLDKARTNIGRVVDVYRAEGLFRRNDLAFAEDTEINRSVSREHAHIQFDPRTGEYRLYNDRWYPRPSAGECGTWIVRDGMSQEVHRTARGTKLEPGDEIHFGQAVVGFALE